jgi:hypothetical protein
MQPEPAALGSRDAEERQRRRRPSHQGGGEGAGVDATGTWVSAPLLSGWVGLVIRFLSIGPQFCSTLPSDPASRRRPCASLTANPSRAERTSKDGCPGVCPPTRSASERPACCGADWVHSRTVTLLSGRAACSPKSPAREGANGAPNRVLGFIEDHVRKADRTAASRKGDVLAKVIRFMRFLACFNFVKRPLSADSTRIRST